MAIIFARVKANAKRAVVKQIDSAHFEVRVKELAREGRANDAVLTALAQHFKIGKSKLKIIMGVRSKQKMIEVGS